MEQKKSTGRPRTYAEGGVRVTIYLPKSLHEKLKSLGGSAWIRKKLQEEK